MTTTVVSPRLTALSCAALALGLALTGCGSPAAPNAEASSQSVTMSPSATTASPSSASTASSTSTTAPAADLATFAFTSQKLSLRYPKAWTVNPSSHPAQGGAVESAAFTDPSGKLLFTVILNFTGYDVGTPVQRTVIESGPLPGLASGAWTPPLQYAFFAEVPTGGPGATGAAGGAATAGAICTLKVVNEVPPDGPGTLRGLPPQGPPQPGVPPTGPSQYGPGWNGPYFLSVELGPQVETCGTADAARSWWASPEGQQIKAAVTSLAAG
ncbi:hypothetical protein GCM10012320_31560 [Sinomonas cellulolyticus]|jgi:hypothetical protein|uniref:Uncharacterized protein n=1 Tax=Sinomonas cellulolyticus TaxID=2801916 RepID=A0ABS1JXT0_9MICC|nr:MULTISPECIES: hypothetical protein [Sinomonas]MBL0704174.1 hypothetical protein [Sinomonas cellulolyticus]GHG58102.1 hypothetical protein GCM10012320_31560 [Sinomonas sp. KCTC 49339]